MGVSRIFQNTNLFVHLAEGGAEADRVATLLCRLLTLGELLVKIKDLSRYQELAPTNIYYDRNGKHYLATASFTQYLLKPDANNYLLLPRSLADGFLTQNESCTSSTPNLVGLPMPRRNVGPGILRIVLSAVRSGKSIEVRCQPFSTHRHTSIRHWITPHAFGHDCPRWHFRAFCHIRLTLQGFPAATPFSATARAGARRRRTGCADTACRPRRAGDCPEGSCTRPIHSRRKPCFDRTTTCYR